MDSCDDDEGRRVLPTLLRGTNGAVKAETAEAAIKRRQRTLSWQIIMAVLAPSSILPLPQEDSSSYGRPKHQWQVIGRTIITSPVGSEEENVSPLLSQPTKMS